MEHGTGCWYEAIKTLLKNTNSILGHVAGNTEAQKRLARNCQAELYSRVINYSFQQCDAAELFFFFWWDKLRFSSSFILCLYLSTSGYRSDLSTCVFLHMTKGLGFWNVLVTLNCENQIPGTFTVFICHHSDSSKQLSILSSTMEPDLFECLKHDPDLLCLPW